MLQFTIREMFLVTTVAALAIGWLIHTHSEQTEEQFLQIHMMDERLAEAKDLIKQLQAVKEKDATEEANIANMTPGAPAVLEPTANQQPAGGGWHVRVVHRRLSGEL
ncbi:MAG TPA: hypothetical protein VGI40_26335 [Pirellulaceae bacterium]|jgi:cell division protein FtsB